MNIKILKRVLNVDDSNISVKFKYEDMSTTGNASKYSDLDNRELFFNFLSHVPIFNTIEEFNAFTQFHFDFDFLPDSDEFKTQRRKCVRIIKAVDVMLEEIDDDTRAPGFKKNDFFKMLKQMLDETTKVFCHLEIANRNNFFKIPGFGDINEVQNQAVHANHEENVRLLAQDFQPIELSRPIEAADNVANFVESMTLEGMVVSDPANESNVLEKIVDMPEEDLENLIHALIGNKRRIQTASATFERIFNISMRTRNWLISNVLGYEYSEEDFISAVEKAYDIKVRDIATSVVTNPILIFDLEDMKEKKKGYEIEKSEENIFNLLLNYRENVLAPLTEALLDDKPKEDTPHINTDDHLRLIDFEKMLVEEFGSSFQIVEANQVKKTRKAKIAVVTEEEEDAERTEFENREDNSITANQLKERLDQIRMKFEFPQPVAEYINMASKILFEPVNFNNKSIGINLIWEYLSQDTFSRIQNIPQPWERMGYSEHSVDFFLDENFRLMELITVGGEEAKDYSKYVAEKHHFDSTWGSLLNHSEILAVNGENFNSIINVLKFWTYILNHILHKNKLAEETKYAFLKLMSPITLYKEEVEKVLVHARRRHGAEQKDDKVTFYMKEQYGDNLISFDFLSVLLMTFQRERSEYLRSFVKEVETEELFNEDQVKLMNELYTKEDYYLDAIREGVKALGIEKGVRGINKVISDKNRFNPNWDRDGALNDFEMTEQEQKSMDKMRALPYLPGARMIENHILKVAIDYYHSRKMKDPYDEIFNVPGTKFFNEHNAWFEDMNRKSNKESDLDEMLNNSFIMFDSSFANIEKKEYFFKGNVPLFQINTKAYESDQVNEFYMGYNETKIWEFNPELDEILKRFHETNFDELEEKVNSKVIFFYEIVVKVPMFRSVLVKKDDLDGDKLGLECEGFRYFTIGIATSGLKGDRDYSILDGIIKWLKEREVLQDSTGDEEIEIDREEGVDFEDAENPFSAGSRISNVSMSGVREFINYHEAIIVTVSSNYVKDLTLENMLIDVGVPYNMMSAYKVQTEHVLYDNEYRIVEFQLEQNFGINCGYLAALYIEAKLEKKRNILFEITRAIYNNDLGSNENFYRPQTELNLAEKILQTLVKNNSSEIVMMFYATTKDHKNRFNYVVVDIIEAPNFSRILSGSEPKNFKTHTFMLEFHKNEILKQNFFQDIQHFIICESNHFYIANSEMVRSFLTFTNEYQVQNSAKYINKIQADQLKEQVSVENMSEDERERLFELEKSTIMRRTEFGELQLVQPAEIYKMEEKFENHLINVIREDYLKSLERKNMLIEYYDANLVEINNLMEEKYIDRKFQRREFPEDINEQKKIELKRAKATGEFDIETTSERNEIMIPFIICLTIDFPEEFIDISFKKIKKTIVVEARTVKKCFENNKEDNIPCLGEFVHFLQRFSEQIQDEIKEEFDLDKKEERELYLAQHNFIKECVKVTLYGWNSSGFDIPLIIPYLEYLNPEVMPVIGDLGRIKFLNYDIYEFEDLFLTVGSSLKDAGVSFKLKEEDEKKKDFDIRNYPSMLHLENNKELIIDYCFEDLAATKAINTAIVTEFNEILPNLQEALFKYLNIEDKVKIEQIKKLNFQKINESFVPTTVSALSELIIETQRGFFIYLLELYNKKAGTDHFDWVYKGTSSEFQHNKEKESYHGGLTFVVNYSALYDGFYVDMNSLYPSVIALDTKPSSYVKTEDYFESRDFEKNGFDRNLAENFLNPNFYKSSNLYAVYAYTFKKGAFIPFCTKIDETNYQFREFQASSVRNKETYEEIWGVEIIESLKEGAIEFIYVGQCHIYKTHPPVQDLYGEIIKFFYEARIEAKKKGQGAKQMLLKIMMNSSYGKKAERNFESTFLMPHDEWTVFEKEELIKNEGELSKFFKNVEKLEIIETSLDTKSGLLELMGDAERAEFFDENEACKSGKKKINSFQEYFDSENKYFKTLNMKNPEIRVTLKEPEYKATDMGSLTFLASFITAAARSRMSAAIFACGGIKNVWYMDTDSLFLNREGYFNLKNKGMLDSQKMGYFKNELDGDNSFYKFEAFSPKCYFLKYKHNEADPWKYKTAFKGVKKIEKKDYHDPNLFKMLNKLGYAYESETERTVFEKINLGSIKNCGRSLFAIPKAKSFVEISGEITFFDTPKDLENSGMIMRTKMCKRQYPEFNHSVYFFQQGKAAEYDKEFKQMKELHELINADEEESEQ